MPYATPTDLIARFGEREVRMLSDRLNTGQVDESVVQRGLDEASAEVDAYLGVRYVVPLATPPALVKNWTMDIARYRMVGTEVMNTQEIGERFKAAIKALEAARDGKLSIGTQPLKPDGDVSPAGNTTSRTVPSVFGMLP